MVWQKKDKKPMKTKEMERDLLKFAWNVKRKWQHRTSSVGNDERCCWELWETSQPYQEIDVMDMKSFRTDTADSSSVGIL